MHVEIPLERTVLANGLEVIVLPDHHAASVSVRLRYYVGSKDEAPREQGLAHYLEHLTYVSSKHGGQDTYFSRMHALGAGGINGETSFDHTDYYFTVPPSSLGAALWTERERMHFAVDGMDAERAARELRIVESEWRLRLEDTELGHVVDRSIGALVPGNHPYAHLPIGNPPALATLDVQRDILPYYHAHYAPNRATLIVAGDVDPMQTRVLVNELFGDLPPAPTRPEPPVVTAARRDPPRLHFVARQAGGAVVLTWLLPPEQDPDLVIARVALQKLSSFAHWSGNHDQLTERVSWQVDERRFGSVGMLTLKGRKGVEPEALLDLFERARDQVDDFHRAGWVGDAQSHCIIDQIFQVNSNDDRAERVAFLASYGRAGDVQGELGRCMKIEAGPVKSWADEFFTVEHAVVARVDAADDAPPAGREVQP